jgi:uncharacterized protein Yka (UPF0111/DUF47 family)
VSWNLCHQSVTRLDSCSTLKHAFAAARRKVFRSAGRTSGYCPGGFARRGERPRQQRREQGRELEIKGDDAVREIRRRLHKTFITPLDPEDIHALAELIDEILNHLDAAAYRFDAFGMEASGSVSEIAGMVDGCVQAVFDAVETLRREGVKKPEALAACCDLINRREFETENRVRELLRDLFRNEKDPIALIKQKEIYELLETTADCCEDVADVLEVIAVKNS